MKPTLTDVLLSLEIPLEVDELCRVLRTDKAGLREAFTEARAEELVAPCGPAGAPRWALTKKGELFLAGERSAFH